MRALIITLDENNKNRAQRCYQEVLKLGFEKSDISFLKGVKGKTYDPVEISKLLSVRANHELKHGRYDNSALSGLGSVGCYMSHCLAWEKCLSYHENIAIFEDDFQCSSGSSKEKLSKILSDNADKDVIRLGYILNSNPNFHTGTSFYVITPQGAEILLKYSKPIETHVDWYINLLTSSQRLKMIFSFHNFYKAGFMEGSEIGHNTLLWNVEPWEFLFFIIIPTIFLTLVAIYLFKNNK